MRGVWIISLENSSFYENATGVGPEMSRPSETWLEPDQWPAEQTRAAQGERVRSYLVEFLGRRSLCRSGYGHMGGWPNEVVVDRFTSIHAID